MMLMRMQCKCNYASLTPRVLQCYDVVTSVSHPHPPCGSAPLSAPAEGTAAVARALGVFAALAHGRARRRLTIKGATTAHAMPGHAHTCVLFIAPTRVPS